MHIQIWVRTQAEGPVRVCVRACRPTPIFTDHGHEQTWLQLCAEADAGVALTLGNTQMFIPAPLLFAPKALGGSRAFSSPSSNPHQCVTLEKPVVFSDRLPPFCPLPSLVSPPSILSSTILSFNFSVPAARTSSWISLWESTGEKELFLSQRNLTSRLGVPWSWVLRKSRRCWVRALWPEQLCRASSLLHPPTPQCLVP